MTSKAVIVCGLGWGDESKGAVCDKLTRELNADLIVRYGGGSQCGHNVVTPDGVHHTFSQFGSGMLANNTVRTHLSRFMLVDPLTMMNEGAELAKKTRDPWDRVTVDGQCVIITPFHKRLNRAREKARGKNRHGSCGMGVGVARELQLAHGNDGVLVVDDLLGSQDFALHMLLNTVEKIKLEIEELEGHAMSWPDVRVECKVLAEQYKRWPVKIVDELPPSGFMVFEGAQGVLLDEKHGEAPYNTWTNTTFENADTLLDEVRCKDRFRIGCLRTYHTRHGAGPFPTEENRSDLPEPHNGTGEFQGAFRVGSFHLPSANYAIHVADGIHGLALSHLDYMERLGLPSNFPERLSDTLGVPLVMKGSGPTAAHRTLELPVYA